LSHQPSRAIIPAAGAYGPDVSYAWLELTLLSQCDSPMQQGRETSQYSILGIGEIIDINYVIYSSL